MKRYQINECFYSLQGEGVRAGCPSIFLRFSACNQSCIKESHGFDCDTEFISGRSLSLSEVVDLLKANYTACKWIVLTGGEPALQADSELIGTLKECEYKLAIETNGSIALPEGIDWITVSPKVAEHALRQLKANEVKYVRSFGQAIPITRVKAEHKLISPAFEADVLPAKTLEWCIQLVRENPEWRLSLQNHKLWKVR